MVWRLGRDSGTHGHFQLFVDLGPTALPHRPTKPVGNRGRIFHGQTRQSDTELLSTVAAYQIVFAALDFQDIGRKADDVITD